LAYALDVSPEERSCAIGVSDGEHLEIVKYGDGTHWVLDACIQNRDRYDEIVLDPAGPAGFLKPQLENVGIKVREVTVREHAQACGGFLTAVTETRVVHLGQAELDRAVANAGRRPTGDGGWLWSRKRSSVDISPLVAVTLARWAAGLAQPAKKPTFAY
jgi:phage terminase large subunit-like protein